MAKVGERAPELTLEDTNGNTVRIGNYEGRKVVLYFYPKDMTPGCTTEACDFRDLQARFSKAGVTVLGVSPDSVDRHKSFTARYDLNFPLLADPSHRVAEAYGVWKEKSFMGRRFMGIERTTFLINERGRIQHVWRKVNFYGHAQEVLDLCKGGKPLSSAASMARAKAAKKKAEAAKKKAAAAKKKAAKKAAKAKPKKVAKKKAAKKKAAKKKATKKKPAKKKATKKKPTKKKATKKKATKKKPAKKKAAKKARR